MPTTLPSPSRAAAQHSGQLTELMQREITARGGWISFARYMELALYAPGLGYYTAGAHKFGEAGDFITAPELSPLFGRTLARQAAEIMAHSAPHMLELGAGSGKLAVDMLGELERLNALPESYLILEVSADLRQRQQTLLREHLPHLCERVCWLDALPGHFSGAVIANEVLDALPVHLVHWQAATLPFPTPALSQREREVTLLERGVAMGEQGFVWQARPVSDAALRAAAERVAVPDGYLSEICLAAHGLINSLARCLKQGALLCIDYGFGAREYYHPQRSNGTLMCHYRHHAHDDPFYFPGLQDITAHVNFTDIAETAIDAGLELMGYTSQAFFLINCGITGLLDDAAPENPRDYLPLSAQLQKLTSPAEMGELFKVMALGKGLAQPLRGFARGDLSRLL